MRDFVVRVRGDWFERAVYLAIIVILGILLTFEYLEPVPVCVNESVIDSTATVTEPAATVQKETPVEQPTVTETTTPDPEPETTDDTQNTQDSVSTGKVSVSISDILTWTDIDANWGKIRAYRLKVENGLSEDIINTEVWNYLYDSNDDDDTKNYAKKIKLPRIKSGDIYETNQLISLSVDEVNVSKTFKVEIREDGKLLAYVSKNVNLQ